MALWSSHKFSEPHDALSRYNWLLTMTLLAVMAVGVWLIVAGLMD